MQLSSTIETRNKTIWEKFRRIAGITSMILFVRPEAGYMLEILFYFV